MVERYIAKRCGNGPESEKAHRHSVHEELIVLRGPLKSAKKRGTLRGNIADMLALVPYSPELFVPRDGVEPPTRGFSVRCSTN